MLSTSSALHGLVVDRPAVPRLVVMGAGGEDLREDHPLTEDRVLVGRSRACGVQLAQDGQVSRRHCELVRSDTGWLVRDLGATHGVHVDGRRVREHALRGGEIVQLGATQLRFRVC